MKANSTFTRSVSVFALASTSFFALALSARAETPTPITALPAVITVPGNYVLNSTLVYTPATGNAITINASNVTIDFQGHFISGTPGGSTTTAQGVYSLNKGNITLKNGTVYSFMRGINLDGTSGGNNVNNQIVNMRILTVFRTGIRIANGIGCRVEDCQVSKSTLYGIGIGGNNTIRNNQVSAAVSIGIWANDASTGDPFSFIVGNTVANSSTGISGGKYQLNLTFNCTTPFFGGTDAGHNN